MPAVPKKAGKNSKGAATEVKLPPYEPNIPEPTTRADLIKYWMPLSLDDKTAQKLLWITEGGTKVARTPDDRTCPYPAKPERYEHSPQVLSKEGLLGSRGYWEVDFQGWVVIGVAYASSGRKDGQACGLGENDSSWGAGWAGSCFHVWHNAESVEVEIPLKTTMGVYVDHPAGIIKFFTVEGESEGEKEVRLIHKYKSNFKDKLLPGLWIGNNSNCQFRKNNQ